MIKNKKDVIVGFVFVILLSLCASAQKINQVDANGKRTGVWRKYYENGDIRYRGQFKNGKEAGKFFFYNQGSPYPSIIKTFSVASDTAVVEFYNKSRVKTAGKMLRRKRVGKWTYYFSDGKTILSEEHYKDGKLHGVLKNYYMNGKITEETLYENGKKHGVSKIYTEEEVLIEQVHFSRGILNGEAKYFDLKGIIQEKGSYKNGKREGEWEFYIDGEVSEKGRPRKNMLKDDKLKKK